MFALVASRFLLMAVKRGQRNDKLHQIGLQGLLPRWVAQAEETVAGWTQPHSAAMYSHLQHAAERQGVDLGTPLHFAEYSAGRDLTHAHVTQLNAYTRTYT
jgi:hypothetical protein